MQTLLQKLSHHLWPQWKLRAPEAAKPKGRGVSRKAPAKPKKQTLVLTDDDDDDVLQLKERLAAYNVNSSPDQLAGIEDAGISFGPVEATGRPTLNLERRLDHDGHPLAMTAADAVAASGVPPWNWRETPGNGGESQSYCGRVISVKWGDYTRRIGIDGSTDAIKEAIRCAFRLRTKRTCF